MKLWKKIKCKLFDKHTPIIENVNTEGIAPCTRCEICYGLLAFDWYSNKWWKIKND